MKTMRNMKDKLMKTAISRVMESRKVRILIGDSGLIIIATISAILKLQNNCTLENGKMINIMEMEYLSAYKQINFMKDNFLMDKDTILEYGKISKDKCT
jgi:hypothetical protein